MVIESIGRDGDGTGNSAGHQLAQEQQDIQADAGQPAERAILLAHRGVLHIVFITDK